MWARPVSWTGGENSNGAERSGNSRYCLQWRRYSYISPSVYNVKWTVNLCKQNFVQSILQQLFICFCSNFLIKVDI